MRSQKGLGCFQVAKASPKKQPWVMICKTLQVLPRTQSCNFVSFFSPSSFGGSRWILGVGTEGWGTMCICIRKMVDRRSAGAAATGSSRSVRCRTAWGLCPPARPTSRLPCVSGGVLSLRSPWWCKPRWGTSWAHLVLIIRDCILLLFGWGLSWLWDSLNAWNTAS